MIIHVLRFSIFDSDHSLLCGSSWKVFAKNLRRIKKNYALRNPLIWCQMSKCPEWVNFHPIWGISWCFRHDYTRFEILEFWVNWDQMSKCLKLTDCRPFWAISWCFRHDYTRFVIFEFWVIWDQMSKCLNLAYYRLNLPIFHDISSWQCMFYHFGFLSQTTTCYVGSPEKFCQTIWEESKKLCSATSTHLRSKSKCSK